MSTFSITNLGADLQAQLHGTTLTNVSNLFGLYNRAASQLLLDLDPQEMIRYMPITTPVANQVFNYALPPDVKGTKIIDILPVGGRNLAPGQNGNTVYLQQYNQAFDVSKLGSAGSGCWAGWPSSPSTSVIFNSGLKSLQLNSPQLPAPTVLNTANNTTSNGTWSTGGGATNLLNDQINFVSYGGSLMFELQAGFTSGYLQNTTMSSNNLSAYQYQLEHLLYTYLSTPNSISGVEFWLGSDNNGTFTNYYSLTVSTTQQNTIFQNGWNFLDYLWSNMTVHGTPNNDALGSIRVTWHYDSTQQNGVRLNDIFSVLGMSFQMEYYSKYLFSNAITGAWQETVLSNSDLINLDTESYQIYLWQVCYQAVQQVQGLSAIVFDANYFLQLYQQSLERYKSQNKSQVQIPQTTYYQLPRGQNQWGHGRYGY